jgi:hypothetical protein
LETFQGGTSDCTDRWGFDCISITAFDKIGRCSGAHEKNDSLAAKALTGSHHVRCADIDMKRDGTSARKAERMILDGAANAFLEIGYRKKALRVKSIFAAPRKSAVLHTGTAL